MLYGDKEGRADLSSRGNRLSEEFESWKTTVEVQMHFNEMLMRLRTTGLSIAITVLGGSVILYRTVEQPLRVWPGLILLLLVIFTGFVFWGVGRFLSQIKGSKVTVEGIGEMEVPGYTKLEKWLLWLVPGISSVYFICLLIRYWHLYGVRYLFTVERHYSIAVFGVVFALTLLASLFVLDRAYYFRLLLGAVLAAEKLEEKGHFKLAKTISVTVKKPQAATLLTLYYWLPGFMGSLFLLLLLFLQ